MNQNEIILLILAAVLGSGGIAAYYRVRSEAPKYTAEAQSIVIANLQSENARYQAENEDLRAQVATLRIRVDLLEGEMRLLKAQVNGTT